jgi:hypothetical protein
MTVLVPAIIGAVLAIAASIFATLLRLDRDRAFYPTVMIVIALLYVLFAAIGGDIRTIAAESMFALLFIVAASVGFRRSLWLVVAALVGHGVFDLLHQSIVSDPSVPGWWPAFCLSYDVLAGAALARLLLRRRPSTAPRAET